MISYNNTNALLAEHTGVIYVLGWWKLLLIIIYGINNKNLQQIM